MAYYVRKRSCLKKNNSVAFLSYLPTTFVGHILQKFNLMYKVQIILLNCWGRISYYCSRAKCIFVIEKYIKKTHSSDVKQLKTKKMCFHFSQMQSFGYNFHTFSELPIYWTSTSSSSIVYLSNIVSRNLSVVKTREQNDIQVTLPSQLIHQNLRLRTWPLIHCCYSDAKGPRVQTQLRTRHYPSSPSWRRWRWWWWWYSRRVIPYFYALE